MAEMTRFFPALVLGAGCLLISGVREQKKVPPRAHMTTVQVEAPSADWKPRDVPISEDEQRVAGMSDFVLREYVRDSLNQFSIYVGYYDYQQQGKSIHSPKNCLPGAGWEQVEASTRFVPTATGQVPVNRFLLANKGAQAMVYYWYQGRGRVESSEYRVKWNLLRDAALYGRTEEALVRIVIPIDARDRAALPARYREADALAMRTAEQLVPRVNAVLPTPPGAS